jgi:hypothetical protein
VQNFSCSEYWDPTLEVATKFISNCEHVFEVLKKKKKEGASKQRAKEREQRTSEVQCKNSAQE